jgi:aarF domain-containing kinase
MLELTFRELFEWKIMQTDPNPANYLYDKEKDVLNLIDLGAGKDFENDFLHDYIEVIHGAATTNREKIMEHSLNLKFLTGDENKEMMDAHYTGVMIVG